MKVDIKNPKYKIGTIIRAIRDKIGLTISSSIKKNQFFKITSFGPGVFQGPDGRHSYFVTQCSKNGILYKNTEGLDQESFEKTLFNDLFEIVSE